MFLFTYPVNADLCPAIPADSNNLAMSKRNYENFEEKDEASLLESGSHSDFTIICKGSEWKVHKNIISL